jgi:hypothetical protein
MILRSALLGAVVVTATLLPADVAAQKSITLQEALQRAKPAVVLVVAEVAAEVTLDCGTGVQKVSPPVFRETGTGWFVDADGWLITNGHVVQPAHEPPRWMVNQQAQRAVTTACLPPVLKRMGLQPGDRPDAEDSARRKVLDAVLPTTKVTLQPQIYVVTAKGRLKAEVKKYSPPVSDMSAKDLALLKVAGEAFPILSLADSRSVQVGDPLHIIGFPGVVLTHELLSKSTMVESVVTNGAVSAIQVDASNNPLIQTDAPASFGNSGGPAVNSRGTVLGVLTFVSIAPGAEGNIVQGFNFVIPSAAVADFVRGTPAKVNGGSKFNDLWFAGLTAFAAEDYGGALRRFEEADKLHPNLPDVRRKLTEAREFVKNPPPRPFPWFWVAVGVTLMSAGGFGGQWLHRWNKNRYRVQPSEVVRLIEAGKSPTVLDVRRGDAYEQLPLRIPGSLRVAPEDIAGGLTGLDLDTTRPVVAYCT